MLIRHKRASAHVIEPVDGSAIEVGPGEVFDVDDAVGEALIEQRDAFEVVADPKAAKAAKKES